MRHPAFTSMKESRRMGRNLLVRRSITHAWPRRWPNHEQRWYTPHARAPCALHAAQVIRACCTLYVACGMVACCMPDASSMRAIRCTVCVHAVRRTSCNARSTLHVAVASANVGRILACAAREEWLRYRSSVMYTVATEKRKLFCTQRRSARAVRRCVRRCSCVQSLE